MDDKNTTPKLLKSGFLVKKGGAKDSLLESWQKRWLTLKYKPLSETHEIEYFKNNSANANPLGLIVLSNKCSIAPSTRKECCLSLMTPDREYFFCAKDHVEMEEWRKAIMEAIYNSTNSDSTIRSYSSSAFFSRTSTDSSEDEEKSNSSQNPPILHPPTSSPQSSNSNHSTASSQPTSASSTSASTSQQQSSSSTPSQSSNSESTPSSSSNGNTMNLSKRLAENKQVLEEYPFLFVHLEDLKWSDVPKLLEQYKRMALTTLVKENRL